MKKVLRLDLDSLMDEFPTSEFDISEESHFILIEKEDKKEFIKEIVTQFKENIINYLELEYMCESCKSTLEYQNDISVCHMCQTDVCDACGYHDGKDDVWICDDCKEEWDNDV